jgi:hypothetical protein
MTTIPPSGDPRIDEHMANILDQIADQLADQARHYSELSGGLAIAVGQLRIMSGQLRANS